MPAAISSGTAPLHGRSFRNYGEFDFPSLVPGGNWFDVYRDFQSKAGKITFKSSLQLETLQQDSCPTYPGWNLCIPDAVRIEAFLKEFREYEKERRLAELRDRLSAPGPHRRHEFRLPYATRPHCG